jgi:DHA1 family tetracycline resistance protein-like MFS transporter
MPEINKPGKAAFIFIFITVVLDMLALGIIIPVLPKLILGLEDGNMASAISITGVFATSWAAMQFFFSPVLGSLSDRFGRRPVILLSNFGLGFDYLMMALAPNLLWLFIGRLISGVTSASYSTAGAYIADVTAPENRAAKFGLLGAAFGLGFVIGPAVGGLLGNIDLRLPFWVAGILSLANAAYGYFILPESLPAERRAHFDWRKANPLGSFNLLRSHPTLLGLTAVALLYLMAHESLPSVFVLYTDYRYHWDSRTVGLVLATIGICSTLVAALLIRPAVAKFGEQRTLPIGLMFGCVGFAMYALAPTSLLFILAIPIFSIWGLAGPSMQALMSRHVGPSAQGQLQGAFSSLRGITGMIGPLIFTQTFAWAVSIDHRVNLPGAPYLLAMLFLLGSLILLAILRLRKLL